MGDIHYRKELLKKGVKKAPFQHACSTNKLTAPLLQQSFINAILCLQLRIVGA
jgi:hypothetical protein